MKKLSELAALALGVALAFGFAACDNGSGDSTTTAVVGNDPSNPSDPATPETPAAPTIPVGFVEVAGSTVTGGTAYKSSVSDNDYIFVADRTVEIGSFYISDHEVTQAEYEAYCKYGSSKPSAGYGKGDSFPAYYVNWYDAIVYCNLRSMDEGLEPVYQIGSETDPKKWTGIVGNETDKYCGPSANNATWNGVTMDMTKNGYRLPTEAEWEYAARGGKDGVASETQYTYVGSDDVGSVAWYTSNSGSKTHEVKGKNPNALGIYDMSGNVCEWCWDWSSLSISSNTPVAGASSGNYRIYRGGSWFSYAAYCAVSFRNRSDPCNRSESYSHNGILGFRVVRSSSE